MISEEHQRIELLSSLYLALMITGAKKNTWIVSSWSKKNDWSWRILLAVCQGSL